MRRLLVGVALVAGVFGCAGWVGRGYYEMSRWRGYLRRTYGCLF